MTPKWDLIGLGGDLGDFSFVVDISDFPDTSNRRTVAFRFYKIIFKLTKSLSK